MVDKRNMQYIKLSENAYILKYIIQRKTKTFFFTDQVESWTALANMNILHILKAPRPKFPEVGVSISESPFGILFHLHVRFSGLNLNKVARMN